MFFLSIVRADFYICPLPLPLKKNNMSLRNLQGRPIQLGMQLPDARTLNMPQICQEQTNWCWAACTEMVLHYYNNPDARQCEFANWLFDQTQCCEDPANPACNRTCSGNEVQDVYTNWNILSTLIEGDVPFDVLQAEIDAGRPVEVAFEWTGGGGHVAIVSGWDTDSPDPFVHVNDPAADRLSRVRYKELLAAYGRGRWILTWTGIQR